MNIVNIPVPILNTYGDPKIERQIIGIDTSGMKALYKSNIETDIWYCMITTTDSLKIFDIRTLMDDETFNKVLNHQIKIVIDLPFEPFYKCIDSVYEDVTIKHNIPSSQVIFMSNMYDASQYNNIIAESLGQIPIEVIWFPSLEFMLHDYDGDIPNTLTDKTYHKKYLNFNRRWRGHRPLLTLLLYHKNLLDSGHVSFAPCEHHRDWDEIWDGLVVGSLMNQELFDILQASKDVKNLPPLYLDTDELDTNRAELTDSTNKYYEDTYFSVISETTFYYRDTFLNSRFITEKTFKAIAMKHPFVLVTIPKSLEVLKKLGYKTFSPWINEDYDQEMDDNKRMLMILKEIERLCNLSTNDLGTFLLAINKICHYNHNLLKSKNNFIYQHYV
jgi:hypothetical protein